MKSTIRIESDSLGVMLTIFDANGNETCSVNMSHDQALEIATALIQGAKCKPTTTTRLQ